MYKSGLVKLYAKRKKKKKESNERLQGAGTQSKCSAPGLKWKRQSAPAAASRPPINWHLIGRLPAARGPGWRAALASRIRFIREISKGSPLRHTFADTSPLCSVIFFSRRGWSFVSRWFVALFSFRDLYSFLKVMRRDVVVLSSS